MIQSLATIKFNNQVIKDNKRTTNKLSTRKSLHLLDSTRI